MMSNERTVDRVGCEAGARIEHRRSVSQSDGVFLSGVRFDRDQGAVDVIDRNGERRHDSPGLPHDSRRVESTAFTPSTKARIRFASGCQRNSARAANSWSANRRAMTRLLPGSAETVNRPARRRGAGGGRADRFAASRTTILVVWASAGSIGAKLFPEVRCVWSTTRPNPAPAFPREAPDMSAGVIAARQEFVRAQTGVALDHVGPLLLRPGRAAGQRRELHRRRPGPDRRSPARCASTASMRTGDFFVPLATTEGTLVASYNRGMRLLTECGGVKTTVVDERMQRAPVFMLRRRAATPATSASGCEDHFDEIRAAAESTTRVGQADRVSASTRSARCGTSASTTPPATPPART